MNHLPARKFSEETEYGQNFFANTRLWRAVDFGAFHARALSLDGGDGVHG